MHVHLLSDEVINRIAAGEVIENSSSVVKELVENSLDAGAENIRVEIEGGGLLCIKVDDDGSGMERKDALLSLERHATSKINSFDDLTNVATMGFRGEALASISAISRMKLLTAVENGILIKVEGGKVTLVEEAVRSKGTTIEVRDLFYNVPVRKGFQKNISSSISDILLLMQKLAMANPNIGFSLTSQGKELLKTSFQRMDFGRALKIRMLELFGESYLKGMKELFFEEGPFCIRGFISIPSNVKKSKKEQHLFVNKRAINSNSISLAVKEGYATRINEQDFPLFILHFDLNSNFVDVNVHPQKREVRFKDVQLIREGFIKAVRKTLEEAPSFFKALSFTNNLNCINANYEEQKFQQFFQEELFKREESFKELGLYYHYYLVERSKELIIIDLKAAYSSLLFSTLTSGKDISGESLAVPIVVEVRDAAEFEPFFKNLSKTGIEMRVVGPHSLAIDSLPSFINREDFALLFSSIFENANLLEQKKLRSTISNFVRGKVSFSREEAFLLFKKAIDLGEFDPLGNRIFMRCTKEDFASLMRSKSETY